MSWKLDPGGELRPLRGTGGRWLTTGGTFPRQVLAADQRWRVEHCGHQTAIRPWFGRGPAGRILAPHGGAFAVVRDARAAVEAAAAGAELRELRPAAGPWGADYCVPSAPIAGHGGRR